MNMRIVVLLLCTVFHPLWAWAMGAMAETGAPEVQPVVHRSIPHDFAAYTQGFFFHQGRLFESTGQYGRSTMRELNPTTGRVIRLVRVPGEFFAEGAAMWNDDILQLTWRSSTLFMRSAEDLRIRNQARFPLSWGNSEGWGLASDQQTLVMSNGTAMLHFLNMDTLDREVSITVLDAGQPVPLLNELEMLGGKVLANVWKSERVAVIDPQTGVVECWLDLSSLRSRLGDEAGVANGLAYDPVSDRLLVTGKNWDKMFELTPPVCPGVQ